MPLINIYIPTNIYRTPPNTNIQWKQLNSVAQKSVHYYSYSMHLKWYHLRVIWVSHHPGFVGRVMTVVERLTAQQGTVDSKSTKRLISQPWHRQVVHCLSLFLSFSLSFSLFAFRRTTPVTSVSSVIYGDFNDNCGIQFRQWEKGRGQRFHCQSVVRQSVCVCRLAWLFLQNLQMYTNCNLISKLCTMMLMVDGWCGWRWLRVDTFSHWTHLYHLAQTMKLTHRWHRCWPI